MQPHARIQKATRRREVGRVAYGGKDGLVWGGRNTVAIRGKNLVSLQQSTQKQAGRVRVQTPK